MLGFNIVDLLIILSLAVYVIVHFKDGFISLTQRLVAFIGSLVMAFLYYDTLSNFISERLATFPGLIDALSFVILFLFFHQIISFILGWIISLLPERAFYSPANKALAVVPALIDGLISSAIILFLLVIVPILPEVKRPIEDSRLGAPLIDRVSSLEGRVNEVFGQAADEALSFLTVAPAEEETVELPFTARSLEVDEEAEKKMLSLLNEEREKMGLKPLIIDETIIVVARTHSFDMWRRSYFAHESPEGGTPFDRMEEGGVEFRRAGENLALARTVERAHSGLMNSEGHRRNILDPTFGRVGIGVVDGGIYGKMFTQNFAD